MRVTMVPQDCPENAGDLLSDAHTKPKHQLQVPLPTSNPRVFLNGFDPVIELLVVAKSEQLLGSGIAAKGCGAIVWLIMIFLTAGKLEGGFSMQRGWDVG